MSSARSLIRCSRSGIASVIGAILLCLSLNPLLVAQTKEASPPETTVGMRNRLKQIVLPGPELEVVEIDDHKSPIILGIDAVYPHGTMFRYDFVYQGLEPGTYDLAKYLRRKDGSSTTDLTPVMVTIKSLLPPGQIEPHAVPETTFSKLGGYGLLLRIGAAAWIAIAVLILTWGKFQPKTKAGDAQGAKTLADRLGESVHRATTGQASSTEIAELERLLMTFQRRRLGYEELSSVDAAANLRAHPEAGPLIVWLEQWLHHDQPKTPTGDELHRMLAPYRDLPPDALETIPRDPAKEVVKV